VIRKVLLAAVLFAALPAAAQSPRLGSFELSLSGYRPSIDSEFGGNAAPFTAAFGNGRGWMFRADVARSLFVDYGSLDLGFGAGYTEKYGHGLLPASAGGGKAADTTSLKIIPTRVSLTYRFDLLAERFGVPFAPYGRVSLERYNWWVNNGSGNTSTAGGKSGYGATNGYSFSGGVAFLLDVLDSGLAREMDRDTGINHTYVFVDFTKSYISDFGSSKSWNLSDEKSVNISGGLLFVF
jgi:hypothetical protein